MMMFARDAGNVVTLFDIGALMIHIMCLRAACLIGPSDQVH